MASAFGGGFSGLSERQKGAMNGVNLMNKALKSFGGYEPNDAGDLQA
jgi:hypothetical protein